MQKNSYDSIAEIYDFVTENPAKRWLKLVQSVAEKHNANRILELGCGTGALCIPLSEKGFVVTGIDFSEKMLKKAKQSSLWNGNCKFLKKDIRNFCFQKKFGLAVSVDTINHILSEQDLLRAFKSVQKSLSGKGVFLFDVLTEKYARAMSAKESFGGTVGESSFVWEDSSFLDYYFIDLSVFRKKKDNAYYRKRIHIMQRLYSKNAIVRALKKAGFGKIRVFGNTKLEKPGKNPKELVFVAQK